MFDSVQVCIVLALLDVLKVTIVLMVPLGVFYGSQALGTVRKIQVFLLPLLPPYHVIHTLLMLAPSARLVCSLCLLSPSAHSVC